MGPPSAQPGSELAPPAAAPGPEGGTERTRRGGRWGTREEARAPGAGGRALRGRAEGRAPGPGTLPPSAFLSHKHRQRAHQPCPALRPPHRPALSASPLRAPPPAAAARRAPLLGRAGRRGRVPREVGGAEHRGGGGFGLAPLLPKSTSSHAGRGAVRPRPGLTSPAPSARGELGCPVSCEAVPDPVASRLHWLGRRRATSRRPPAARPRGSALGSRAGGGRAARRCALAGPPCASCAPCPWRVPCSPPPCCRVRATRPPPPPPSSRDSASRTRSPRRARPRWVRIARSGPAAGGGGGEDPRLSDLCVRCHLVSALSEVSKRT